MIVNQKCPIETGLGLACSQIQIQIHEGETKHKPTNKPLLTG